MAPDGETPVLKLRPRRTFVSLRKSNAEKRRGFATQAEPILPEGKTLPSFISKKKSSSLSLRLPGSKKRPHVTLKKRSHLQTSQPGESFSEKTKEITTFKADVAEEISVKKNVEVTEKLAFRPFQFSNPQIDSPPSKNIEVTEKLQYNPFKKVSESTDNSLLSVPPNQGANKNREVTEKLQFNPAPSPELKKISKLISSNDNTEVMGKVDYKAVEKLTSPPAPLAPSNKIKVVSPGFRPSDPTHILEKPSVSFDQNATLTPTSLTEPPPPNKNREVTEKLVFNPVPSPQNPVFPVEVKPVENLIKTTSEPVSPAPFLKKTTGSLRPPPPPPVAKRDTTPLKASELPPAINLPLPPTALNSAQNVVPTPKPLPPMVEQKISPPETVVPPKRITTAVPSSQSPPSTVIKPTVVETAFAPALSPLDRPGINLDRPAIEEHPITIKPAQHSKLLVTSLFILSWLTAAYLMASFMGHI